MSVSSVSTSVPPQSANPANQQNQPSPPDNNNDDNSDAVQASAQAQAPLPPGQGTRIDQMV